MAKYKSEDSKISINFFLKPGVLKRKPERKILAMISINYSKTFYVTKFKKHFKSINQHYDELKKQGKVINTNHKSKKVYKPLLISTRLSIPEKFWDNTTKQTTGSYSDYNDLLDNFKGNIRKLYESLSLVKDFDFSPENFHAEIKKHIFNEGKEHNNMAPFVRISDNEVKSIPTLITEFIQFKIDELLEADPKAEVRRQRNLKKWILDYEEEFGIRNKKKDYKIDMLTINDSVLESFATWVCKQYKDEENKITYKVSYQSKIKTCMINYLRVAKNDHHIPVPPVNFEMKVLARINEKVDDIYLNEEHFEKIRKAVFHNQCLSYEAIRKVKDRDERTHLKKEKDMEVCRDLMLVHKACGLRVEDFLKYKTLYNEGNTYFFEYTKTDKTNAHVKIPLFDIDNEVIQIYKKYGNEFPTKYFYSVLYNEMIKEVAIRAGLDEAKIVKHMNVNNRSKNIETPKHIWELCSARTFRKTFASRMIRIMKLPIIVVMSWTGHTSETEFKKYIRLNAEMYMIALETTEDNKKAA